MSDECIIKHLTDGQMDFSFEASLPFSSARDAKAVAEALAADAELRPEHVSREITVDEETLKALLDYKAYLC